MNEGAEMQVRLFMIIFLHYGGETRKFIFVTCIRFKIVTLLLFSDDVSAFFVVLMFGHKRVNLTLSAWTSSRCFTFTSCYSMVSVTHCPNLVLLTVDEKQWRYSMCRNSVTIVRVGRFSSKYSTEHVPS